MEIETVKYAKVFASTAKRGCARGLPWHFFMKGGIMFTQSINWENGPDVVDDIIATSIKPMRHLVKMIDAEILEEPDDKSDNILFLNIALGQLLENLEDTIERVGEEWGYEVNYKDKKKEKAA